MYLVFSKVLSILVFFLEYLIFLGKWSLYEELNLSHVNLYFTLKLLVCKKETEQDLIVFKHALTDLRVESASEFSLKLPDS